ncbi:MAG: S8 family serine peptidase [Armatimonadetes bacterium]|nr:S8 family serine peptidase [Armatimonadota bacterium]
MQRLLLLPLFLLLGIAYLANAQQRPQFPPAAQATPERESHYRPRVVILKLKASVPNRRDALLFGVPAIDALLQQADIRQRRPLYPMAPYSAMELFSANSLRFDKTYVISYANPIDPRTVANQLRETGLVEYAAPYRAFRIAKTPNDPRLAEQYWVKQSEAEAAWEITTGDTSIAIGIIDSGVEWSHQDLRDNVAVNWGETGTDGSGKEKQTNGIDDDGNGYADDFYGWDFIGNLTEQEFLDSAFKPDNNPEPQPAPKQIPHGTLVAGCASAVTNNDRGVAGAGYHTRLILTKCAPDSSGAMLYDVYDAMRYAVDRGARILNLSWGAAEWELAPGELPLIEEAIAYARSNNVLVVASAGNDGLFLGRNPFYPAGLPGVLSVGASNANNNAAGFSNYGAGVTLFAAGQAILSTSSGNSYQPANGTSFAAPIVSGAAALVMALHPDWTPDQIRMQLRVTGDTLQLPHPYTYRRLNMRRALELNRDLTAATGTLPGIALTSYTLHGNASDTLRSASDRVKVRLSLTNWLAPGKNIQIAPWGESMLLADPVAIQTIGTKEGQQIEVVARLNPDRSLFSEGKSLLILQLSNGEGYRDVIAIPIEVDLPGLRTQSVNQETEGNTSFAVSVATPSRTEAWVLGYAQRGPNDWFYSATRTTDGQTWEPFARIPGTEKHTIRAISAVDSNNAVVAGYGRPDGELESFVLRTSNGGKAWEQATITAVADEPTRIWMFDKKEGIVCGKSKPGAGSGIGRTSDGGATWSPVELPDRLPQIEDGIMATIGNTIYLSRIGRDPASQPTLTRIYRSDNRGQTWRVVDTLPQAAEITSMAFATPEQGMMQLLSRSGGGNQANQLQATTDGGGTWIPRGNGIPSGYRPTQLAAMSGRIYLAASDHTLESTGGLFGSRTVGASWEQIPVPAGLNFFDIGYGAQMAGGGDGEGNTLWLAQYSLYGYREAKVSSAPIQEATSISGLATVANMSVAPNPADRTTTLQFQLRRAASVELALCTNSGQQVWGNRSRQLAAGDHTALIDCSAMPQGSYYLSVTANGERTTYPVAVIRQ